MFYAAELGEFRHVIGQGGTAWHIKEFVPDALSFVFLHYPAWNVKQAYHTFALGLLPFEPYPKVAFGVLAYISRTQVAHVDV